MTALATVKNAPAPTARWVEDYGKTEYMASLAARKAFDEETKELRHFTKYFRPWEKAMFEDSDIRSEDRVLALIRATSTGRQSPWCIDEHGQVLEQKHIAAMLDVSETTVSRAYKEWTKKGLVEKRDKRTYAVTAPATGSASQIDRNPTSSKLLKNIEAVSYVRNSDSTSRVVSPFLRRGDSASKTAWKTMAEDWFGKNPEIAERKRELLAKRAEINRELQKIDFMCLAEITRELKQFQTCESQNGHETQNGASEHTEPAVPDVPNPNFHTPETTSICVLEVQNLEEERQQPAFEASFSGELLSAGDNTRALLQFADHAAIVERAREIAPPVQNGTHKTSEGEAPATPQEQRYREEHQRIANGFTRACNEYPGEVQRLDVFEAAKDLWFENIRTDHDLDTFFVVLEAYKASEKVSRGVTMNFDKYLRTGAWKSPPKEVPREHRQTREEKLRAEGIELLTRRYGPRKTDT